MQVLQLNPILKQEFKKITIMQASEKCSQEPLATAPRPPAPHTLPSALRGLPTVDPSPRCCGPVMKPHIQATW